MKVLDDMRLKLENPNWALDSELALVGTTLNEDQRHYEIIAPGIMNWVNYFDQLF
jgi:hypothetical protein